MTGARLLCEPLEHHLGDPVATSPVLLTASADSCGEAGMPAVRSCCVNHIRSPEARERCELGNRLTMSAQNSWHRGSPAAGAGYWGDPAHHAATAQRNSLHAGKKCVGQPVMGLLVEPQDVVDAYLLGFGVLT